MTKLKNWTLKKYVDIKNGGQEGQCLAEYGLILALTAVVCIGALEALGGSVGDKLNSLAGTITGS
jgi:pilus assembly protein Flp/PilA